jgi:TolB protein
MHEIWRLNADGSGPLQLTNDKRENGSPAWSPDGKQFAYYSKQVDGSYQIMVAPADDPTKARKLTNAGNNWTPVWSPDGNWIAFASTRGGRLDVWMMDKNGGNVQPLSDKYGAESQLPGSWR